MATAAAAEGGNPVMPKVKDTEVTLYGHAIPAGTMVWCLLGSANHDERHYRDPGRVNFLREPVAHHAFGGGRHFCLGAMLARLEIQEFLRQSVRRWRQVEIRRGEISRRAQFQFRSIQRLPAHFSPPPNAAGAKPTQR